MREKTGSPVLVHPDDVERMLGARRQGLLFGLPIPDPPQPDRLVEDGDTVSFGGRAFRVVHTPGHTPGCVCYITDGRNNFV